MPQCLQINGKHVNSEILKNLSLIKIEIIITAVSILFRCKTRLDQLTQHNFRFSQGLDDHKLSKNIAAGLRDLLRCELFPDDNKFCTSYPGKPF